MLQYSTATFEEKSQLVSHMMIISLFPLSKHSKFPSSFFKVSMRADGDRYQANMRKGLALIGLISMQTNSRDLSGMSVRLLCLTNCAHTQQLQPHSYFYPLCVECSPRSRESSKWLLMKRTSMFTGTTLLKSKLPLLRLETFSQSRTFSFSFVA